MMEQMRMEIIGAKSRQEKMRTLESDKYFTSKSKRIGDLFRYITSFDFFFCKSFKASRSSLSYFFGFHYYL